MADVNSDDLGTVTESVNHDKMNGELDAPTVNGEAMKSVIIVGAGPVGMFTALKLGKAGIHVTLIEKEIKTSDAPRAIGYYAAAMLALVDAGVYDQIREEGFVTKGICWRKKPFPNAEGGKELGDMIAALPLAAYDDEILEPPAGVLCLQQPMLTRLFLREAVATGNVDVLFSKALIGIEDDGESVTAILKDMNGHLEQRKVASFLIGADGGRSTTRKLLNIPLLGHTWPERFIATNVSIRNHYDPDYPLHYVMDRINYTVVVPLTTPRVGEVSLWRYTMSTDPEDTRSDEELTTDENIGRLYEMVMAGPRPLQYDIKARSVYKIHQRLAATFRRGRSVLVGDAAHLCNPYGGMGLNTGLLDAQALSEALIMIMNESQSVDLLDVYSDERRKVFQTFVDPTTTYNKLRVHGNDQEDAVKDDWFFRLLAHGSHEEVMEVGKPYFETWGTDMRKFAKKTG